MTHAHTLSGASFKPGTQMEQLMAFQIDAINAENERLREALEKIVRINGSTRGAKALVDEFKHIAKAALARTGG